MSEGEPPQYLAEEVPTNVEEQVLEIKKPRKKPNGFWQNPDNIEAIAKQHVDSGGLLTYEDLSLKGIARLGGSANKFYPGGFSAIQEKFGQPLDRKERGYWENPANILAEARNAIRNNVVFTQKELGKSGLSSLGRAISLYYPGGMQEVRQDLGLDQLRVPRGYWQDAANIEKEAKTFVEQGGKLSGNSLRKSNKGNLLSAIENNYHGGVKALRRKLGEVEELERPKGYWKDLGNIESAARVIFEREGVLTSETIKQTKDTSLLHAIHKYYPDGMRGLQERVGAISRYKPVGYWTQANIESEAREFFELHGDLTSTIMTATGRSDLVGAIQQNYKGGLSALKDKLGVITSFVPRGFWTTETIEQEARKFLDEHGDINHVLMRAGGKSGLAAAIQRHYPGGMNALKGVLERKFNLNSESQISPDKADEMMRGLEVLP